MKKIFWVLLAVLFFIIYFGKKIVDFLVEWIWFISVGYQDVLYKVVFTRIFLFLIFAVIFFLILYLNIYMANRLKPKIADLNIDPLENFLRNTRIKKFSSLFIILAAALLSLLFAYEVSLRWEMFLQFFNAVGFGKTDPVFSKDIGFYIFKLPLIKYLYGWIMFLLFVNIITAGFIYFSSRALQYIGKEVYFTKAAKAHIFILLALLLALKGLGYRLNMYDLLYSTKGVVFGATYIDIYGYLPLFYILEVAAFICAAVAVVSIFVKNWKILAGSIIVFIAVSLLGTVYPTVLQKLVVKPNEIDKETKFIEYSIKHTRDAYKLNTIKERDFPSIQDITYKDIQDNNATIKNVRLWDHKPILATYEQLQEIRQYYKFSDVDNDRYYINGQYTQTMLSPREISYNELESREWINEHLVYTHGYGFCMGPVNKATPEGLPDFFVKDIPPVTLDDINITRPEIYFGELSNEYSFVNTKNDKGESPEFDYPSGNKNIFCEYKGDGQIKVGSILRKLLFALKFSQSNIFFSDSITNDSKLMYHKKVYNRVKKCAPLVYFDNNDIYMVVGKDGKLYWIVEGFTVSGDYPYSRPAEFIGSYYGNYIRNSVKAVVDAYTGKIDYYVSDPDDPIIKVQSKIFPGAFKELSRMPDHLKAHLRYPVKLFKIQAEVYSLYHMTDPQVFYNKEDLWRISRTSSGGDGNGSMEPYYTILKFPNATQEEFILMIPFSPVNKNNMIAWMAARCDFPHYGGIVTYRFPKKKLIYGPSQIDARIDQNPDISKQLTLWGQGGSRVQRGSLLVIPIEESLLYIEPLYLSAEKGQLPELKRIIVSYKDNVVMEDNLEEALRQIFKGIKASPVKTVRIKAVDEEIESSAAKEPDSVKDLINKASDTYNAAVNAQKDGNWALYGNKINELKDILKELKQKSGK
ncbi:MAG: UPF0182 family protein [Armatimonadota bacterium]